MLTGKIVSANVVGTPKPGDALKLKVVFNAEATEGEEGMGWTVAVAAANSEGNLIGWDDTSLSAWDYKIQAKSVEFTCSIKMPSTPINVTIALYGHPSPFQKIEDYLS